MLKIKNLNLNFEDNVIFKDCNIQIPKNLVTVINGLNGAGKSTLLKVITGNLKAECKITNEFKKTFYLPQNPYFPKGISAFDYLSTVFFKDTWKWFLNQEEKEKINEILKTVGLYEKKDVNIENLSGGELQKANVALGLLSGADLFLLDEPESNLDLVNQIKILDMIKNLTNKGITSVIILHDLNLSSAYGDYFIGFAKTGEIIQAGKEEFFTNEMLKKVYGIDFKIVHEKGKIYVQILD